MPKIRPGILGVPRSAGYPRSSSAPMKQPGDSGGDRRLPPARSDNRSSGGRMVTSAPWAPTQGRQDGRGREPKRRRLVLCCIHGAPGDSTRRIRLQLAAAVLWADLVRRPCSDSGSDAVRPMGRNPVLQQSRAPEPGEPAIYRAHRPDRYTDLRASAPIGCRHRWLRGRDTSVNDPGQHTSRRSPGPGGECWEAVAEDGGVGDPHTL